MNVDPKFQDLHTLSCMYDRTVVYILLVSRLVLYFGSHTWPEILLLVFVHSPLAVTVVFDDSFSSAALLAHPVYTDSSVCFCIQCVCSSMVLLFLQVIENFGEPLKAYGEMTSRGRRRHVR